MTAKELAEILLQNPNSEVTVLVRKEWHLSTPIKKINLSFDRTIIALVVDDPKLSDLYPEQVLDL